MIKKIAFFLSLTASLGLPIFCQEEVATATAEPAPANTEEVKEVTTAPEPEQTSLDVLIADLEQNSSDDNPKDQALLKLLYQMKQNQAKEEEPQEVVIVEDESTNPLLLGLGIASAVASAGVLGIQVQGYRQRRRESITGNYHKDRMDETFKGLEQLAQTNDPIVKQYAKEALFQRGITKKLKNTKSKEAYRHELNNILVNASEKITSALNTDVTGHNLSKIIGTNSKELKQLSQFIPNDFTPTYKELPPDLTAEPSKSKRRHSLMRSKSEREKKHKKKPKTIRKTSSATRLPKADSTTESDSSGSDSGRPRPNVPPQPLSKHFQGTPKQSSIDPSQIDIGRLGSSPGRHQLSPEFKGPHSQRPNIPPFKKSLSSILKDSPSSRQSGASGRSEPKSGKRRSTKKY